MKVIQIRKTTCIAALLAALAIAASLPRPVHGQEGAEKPENIDLFSGVIRRSKEIVFDIRANTDTALEGRHRPGFHDEGQKAKRVTVQFDNPPDKRLGMTLKYCWVVTVRGHEFFSNIRNMEARPKGNEEAVVQMQCYTRNPGGERPGIGSWHVYVFGYWEKE